MKNNLIRSFLSNLIDATAAEGGGEVSPETLSKTLETTEDYFGK